MELAKRATGCTSSNPLVGCVIVKDSNIVGEGFHPIAGQPHAEVTANEKTFMYCFLSFSCIVELDMSLILGEICYVFAL